MYKQLLVNSLADLQAALNSQLAALTSTDVEFEQRRVSYKLTLYYDHHQCINYKAHSC